MNHTQYANKTRPVTWTVSSVSEHGSAEGTWKIITRTVRRSRSKMSDEKERGKKASTWR